MIESIVAVFIYKEEIFCIKRQLTLKAFPGYTAFPGGKIDKGESEKTYTADFLKEFEPRWMRALCRELDEELDFDLESAVENNDVIDIKYIGLARPPLKTVGKFMAYHFKIVLNKKVEFTANAHEAITGRWIPVKELLNNYESGRILAVVPTIRIIQALARNINTDSIEPMNVVYDPEIEIPILELIGGIHFLFIASLKLKASHRTNAFIMGDPSYLIDPSPESEEELEKVLESIKHFNLSGILITHHHPDHHKHAVQIAQKLNLHIKCGAETHRLLLKRFGANYTGGVEVIHVREGDILTKWLGENVTIYEIPGHDQGQIGLAPDSMEWFLVGDLIQADNWNTVGTVIPEDVGDMRDYFRSLERIIGLSPNVIIPSHGMPMGSTLRLEKTLDSRKKREEQILQLNLEGKDEDEILQSAYALVDESLRMFARLNIRAHLNKLKKENKI